MHFRHDLPRARQGECIGLLGGSFDPPHPGHLHVSREAMKRFCLDRVWWLVSPGNPLKARGPAGLDRRIAAARALVSDPRILVTGIEAQLGTRYTAATLAALFKLYPRANFVWLMGADNLAQFHLWDRWQWIMMHIPVGVIARPEHRLAARISPAAARFRFARHGEAEAGLLARLPPPAWCLVNVPMSDASSSAIRASGSWTAQ
jgi:nicotinate-nucleotide adenylyltransferase